MSPENAQLLERLAVALAIGLLMGLERGWEYRQLPEGGRVAGIRTFGLIALLGAIAVQLGGPYHELFLAAAILAVALLMGVGYWRETEISEDVSITTSIAALVAFSLGAMAGLGHLTIASSAAVVITTILGFRIELHSLVAHIEREELTATLRLLLITVVVLPILPNRAIGPWQAFNPYQIWWMVVLIAALSYVGYFANKFLGERRGMIVTGLFGGMTSSTAVTLTLSPDRANSQGRARGGSGSHPGRLRNYVSAPAHHRGGADAGVGAEDRATVRSRHPPDGWRRRMVRMEIARHRYRARLRATSRPATRSIYGSR